MGPYLLFLDHDVVPLHDLCSVAQYFPLFFVIVLGRKNSSFERSTGMVVQLLESMSSFFHLKTKVLYSVSYRLNKE